MDGIRNTGSLANINRVLSPLLSSLAHLAGKIGNVFDRVLEKKGSLSTNVRSASSDKMSTALAAALATAPATNPRPVAQMAHAVKSSSPQVSTTAREITHQANRAVASSAVTSKAVEQPKALLNHKEKLQLCRMVEENPKLIAQEIITINGKEIHIKPEDRPELKNALEVLADLKLHFEINEKNGDLSEPLEKGSYAEQYVQEQLNLYREGMFHVDANGKASFVPGAKVQLKEQLRVQHDLLTRRSGGEARVSALENRRRLEGVSGQTEQKATGPDPALVAKRAEKRRQSELDAAQKELEKTQKEAKFWKEFRQQFPQR